MRRQSLPGPRVLRDSWPGYAGASALAAKIFTIFEGTSEIQRMLIGRAITGLDVR
jgi:alkylation response protein AidB-like acyl-CoA dehydrogenase